MSKKLIAILTVATIVFVCVFAACEKEEGIYSDSKDYDFVTDENGEKVLSDDGQFLVYATDENGKHVTNADGEKETLLQQFTPLEEDGVIEDYGFKLTLPDGWKSVPSSFGSFINNSKGITCDISIVEYFYDDYYLTNKDFYKKLNKENVEVLWEEDIDFGKEYNGVCRFTMTVDDQVTVLYFFENSDNVYKLLFQGPKSDTLISDTEEFCKSMEFKAFTYYDDITKIPETTQKVTISETTDTIE